MCISKFIKYTCGCKKEMEFIQCQERQLEGLNVRCHPITKEWGKDSANYCSKHLVKADAPVKYKDTQGAIVEEQE
jgi:hypothetical protein